MQHPQLGDLYTVIVIADTSVGTSAVGSDVDETVCVACAIAGVSLDVELPQALNMTSDIPKTGTTTVPLIVDLFIFDYLLKVMLQADGRRGRNG